MKLHKFNPILNLTLFLLLCFLAASGLLLEFRLGYGPARNAIWGMDRHQWADWHSLASYFLLAIMALHLIIHWRWIIQVACRTHYWKLITVLAAGLGITAIVLMGPSSGANFRRDQQKMSYSEMKLPAGAGQGQNIEECERKHRHALSRDVEDCRHGNKGRGRGRGYGRRHRSWY